MRAIIQRVDKASVVVGTSVKCSINKGLLVLLGVTTTDSTAIADWLVEKFFSLRVFPDQDGKMNVNIQEARGDLLIVSQFTLYGELLKGTRPSFMKAAEPELARTLYNYTIKESIKRSESGKTSSHRVRVETGEFGAMMKIESVNNGPVTIILDR